jgi:hypothetical protein
MPAGRAVQASRSLRHSPARADDGAVTSNARLHLACLRLLPATILAFLLAASLFVASADALVVESGGTKVGIQDREIARYWEGQLKWTGLKAAPEANAPAATFNNAGGHPVLHAANTYTIFWDPEGGFYNGDWQGLIDGFMANLGSSNGQLNSAFALDSQYTDATNQPATSRSVFHGGATDTNPYPVSGCTDPRPFEFHAPLNQVCLTDTQIRAELQTYIAQHSLPRGMSTVFYIMTPPGVAVCLDAGGVTGRCSDFAGTIKEVETAETKKEEPTVFKSYKKSFCSYHGAIGNGDGNTVLYAAIPWSAGGEGDNSLSTRDQAPAYDCQDGGFEPSKQVNGELQEKEREKVKTPLEEEEFNNKNPQEKREQEEAEAAGLQGAHEQEPNQLGGRSPDGGFDHGLADLIINQIAVEQQNTVTDPLLNAWQDSAGSEVTDECRNFFVPSTSGSVTANPASRAGTLADQELNGKGYYVNGTFNAASLRLPFPSIPCLKAVTLEPAFTAPDPVNSGEVVGFDGMESDITLNSTINFPSGATVYPTYTWDFGDGSPTVTGFAPGQAALNSPNATPCQAPWLSPCAASTFHEYRYGGTYAVTLTAKDVGGNVASVTHEVTVDGPSPPTPETGGGSSSGGSTQAATGSGSSSTTPAHATPAPAAHPAPAATQAVASHSLSSVLKSGLVIRYSVNEQVAGRFEVLLASSIARKLGIHGTAATGLAKGTAPQTIISKAILVTTKGGHSTYRLKFSKTTAARLRKLPKVSLMIRLVVHNAASPAVTTVLNTVNLSR